MTISLSDRGGPAYKQLVEHIRTLVVTGDLGPGAELPSVRDLALQVGTSSLTVHKAYQELAKLGLVECHPRQGTRVSALSRGPAARSRLQSLPDQGPTPTFELLAETNHVRSMASSVGDPTLFQSDELLAEIMSLRGDSEWDFYYGEPAGLPDLLTQIGRLLPSVGIDSSEAGLVATTGSTRALSLALEAVTSPGDVVLVQEPGRLWLAELLKARGLLAEPIRIDGDGLDLDHTEWLAKTHKPKAAYVAPDFGHATGLCMPGAQRETLVDIAQSQGFMLIEDGAFSALRYGPRIGPALAALAPESCFYSGSFSYSLCPGIRTGFLKVPTEFRSRVVGLSQATGVSGPRFLQRAFAWYLANGAYANHIKRVLPRYRARRDATVSALTLAMPEWVAWTMPVGGLSCWVTLPEGQSATELYGRAVRRGVAFSPGRLFVTSGNPERHLRLSFGMLEPDAIREAVYELGRLMHTGD